VHGLAIADTCTRQNPLGLDPLPGHESLMTLPSCSSMIYGVLVFIYLLFRCVHVFFDHFNFSFG
jgi:hypothetical protein